MPREGLARARSSPIPHSIWVAAALRHVRAAVPAVFSFGVGEPSPAPPWGGKAVERGCAPQAGLARQGYPLQNGTATTYGPRWAPALARAHPSAAPLPRPHFQ